MSKFNPGYVPITEEVYDTLSSKWESLILSEKYYLSIGTQDKYQEVKTQKEEIEVILCKAGRSLPRFHSYPEEIKKRSGARYVPIEEANAIGQTGLPEVLTLGDNLQVLYVWVWPEGHPFIRPFNAL